MKKILLTSVGSLAGLSTLQCLQAIPRELRIVGTNSDPKPSHMYDCNKLYLTGKTADVSTYEKELRKILDTEKPDLVIPCRDEELEILGILSEEPNYSNIVFFAPPKKLTSVFNDKFETWKFSQKNNLSFAYSAFYKNEASVLLEKKGYPLLAKPRFCGHASKDVYIVSNDTELGNIVKEERFVIQEILNPGTLGKQLDPLPPLGKPFSISMSDIRIAAEIVIDKKGNVISLSTVESNTTGSVSIYMFSIDNPRVNSVATEWATQLAKEGHFGVLNLQGKLLENGEFVPFELNARFTGSAIARKYLGYNQVEHAVEYFLFNNGPWPNHQGENNISLSRIPFFVPTETKNIKVLSSNKEWEDVK